MAGRLELRKQKAGLGESLVLYLDLHVSLGLRRARLVGTLGLRNCEQRPAAANYLVLSMTVNFRY